MKTIISFFAIFVLLIFISCGSNDASKEDQTLKNNTADSIQTNTNDPVQDNTETKTKIENPVNRVTPVPINKIPNDLLTHIDKYLVSKPDFSTPAASDIANGMVSVQNTLTNITFQKAILEVIIVYEDGKQIGPEYFILQNFEPGDIKSVPIHKIPKGATINSYIVKIKSDKVTNGETVPVGTRYVSQ